MTKKVLIPTVLCGVLLATSAMAFPWGDKGARDGDGQRGPQMRQQLTQEQHEVRAEQMLKRMSILLKLDDKQQTQLKQILDQQWQGRQEMRETMQASCDAMLAYRLDDKFDAAEFRKLAEKEAAVKVDMMVQREKNHNDFISVLTAEQQEKLEKLKDMERGPRRDKEGRNDRGGNDSRGDRDGDRGGKDGRMLINPDS
jgi:Spy/CpxP family protein refolding chaperone